MIDGDDHAAFVGQVLQSIDPQAEEAPHQGPGNAVEDRPKRLEAGPGRRDRAALCCVQRGQARRRRARRGRLRRPLYLDHELAQRPHAAHGSFFELQAEALFQLEADHQPAQRIDIQVELGMEIQTEHPSGRAGLQPVPDLALPRLGEQRPVGVREGGRAHPLALGDSLLVESRQQVPPQAAERAARQGCAQDRDAGKRVAFRQPVRLRRKGQAQDVLDPRAVIGGHRIQVGQDAAMEPVAACQHGDLLDQRAGAVDRLEFFREQALAAQCDALRHGARQAQPAMAIEGSEIAGPEPAVAGEQGAGQFHVPGDLRAAQFDFAQSLPVRLGRPQVQAAKRPAGCSLPTRPAKGNESGDTAHRVAAGHAPAEGLQVARGRPVETVGAGNQAAQPRSDLAVQRPKEAAAKAQAETGSGPAREGMPGSEPVTRGTAARGDTALDAVQPGLVERRYADHGGRAGKSDRMVQLPAGHGLGQHQAGTAGQHPIEPDRQRIDLIHRQGQDHPVARLEQAGLDQRRRAGQEIFMAEAKGRRLAAASAAQQQNRRCRRIRFGKSAGRSRQQVQPRHPGGGLGNRVAGPVEPVERRTIVRQDPGQPFRLPRTGKDQPGPALDQPRGDFLVARGLVQRHRDRAERAQRQAQDDPLDRVRRHDRHGLAAAQAMGREARGKAQAGRRQFGPRHRDRPAAPKRDQRRASAMGGKIPDERQQGRTNLGQVGGNPPIRSHGRPAWVRPGAPDRGVRRTN